MRGEQASPNTLPPPRPVGTRLSARGPGERCRLATRRGPRNANGSATPRAAAWHSEAPTSCSFVRVRARLVDERLSPDGTLLRRAPVGQAPLPQDGAFHDDQPDQVRPRAGAAFATRRSPDSAPRARALPALRRREARRRPLLRRVRARRRRGGATLPSLVHVLRALERDQRARTASAAVRRLRRLAAGRTNLVAARAATNAARRKENDAQERRT